MWTHDGDDWAGGGGRNTASSSSRSLTLALRAFLSCKFRRLAVSPIWRYGQCEQIWHLSRNWVKFWSFKTMISYEETIINGASPKSPTKECLKLAWHLIRMKSFLKRFDQLCKAPKCVNTCQYWDGSIIFPQTCRMSLSSGSENLGRLGSSMLYTTLPLRSVPAMFRSSHSLVAVPSFRLMSWTSRWRSFTCWPRFKSITTSCQVWSSQWEQLFESFAWCKLRIWGPP